MPSSKNADTFYILDFDRTLARTDDLRELYESVIEVLTPVTVAEIHEARERIKSNFDVSAYVRERLGRELSSTAIDKAMVKARRVFIEKARNQDLLEPYAQEFLAYLQLHGLPHGILTTGGDEWQQTKIEAAKLEAIPHLIIETTRKGELIAGWQQADKTFLLPDALIGERNHRAHSLVFLDDKTISFQGMPTSVKGIRVISRTAGEPYEAELALPANVLQVHGLYEAYTVLFNS